MASWKTETFRPAWQGAFGGKARHEMAWKNDHQGSQLSPHPLPTVPEMQTLLLQLQGPTAESETNKFQIEKTRKKTLSKVPASFVIYILCFSAFLLFFVTQPFKLICLSQFVASS